MILPLGPENPLQRKPYVTWGLLGVNLFVYIAHTFFASSWLQWIITGGLVPARISAASPLTVEGFFAYATLVSCAFLHGGLFHLLGNAFFLYAYGCKLEERLGHLRFLAFYLLVQVSMAGAFVLLTPSSAIPLVGASGAISGILGAYLLKFPHTRIKAVVWVFIRVWLLRVPAYVLLGFWLLVNIIYASSQALSSMSNVAWSAHLLGFGFGLLWIVVFAGYRIESSAADEKTHRWKETFRSVKTLLRGEFRYLILFIILPLAMYGMAWIATYLKPSRYESVVQHYTMGMRARYAFGLLLNNYPIFLALVGMGFGVVWLRKRQKQMQRIMDVEACLLCGAEDTQEDEDGFVQCSACGFDSRVTTLHDDPRAPWFQLLKQLRIAETFLKEAEAQIAQEIAQSSLVSFSQENVKDSFEAYEGAMELFRELLQQHDASLRELLPAKKTKSQQPDAAISEASAEGEAAAEPSQSSVVPAALPARFAREDLAMLKQVTPTYITGDGSHKSQVELKRQQEHILRLTLSFLRQVTRHISKQVM